VHFFPQKSQITFLEALLLLHCIAADLVMETIHCKTTEEIVSTFPHYNKIKNCVLEEVKSTRGGDHGEMKTRTFPR